MNDPTAGVSRAKRRNVAKKVFIGGFLLLPWLWLQNTMMFWHKAFKPNADPQLNRYVKGSTIGAGVMSVIFIVYVSIMLATWNNGEAWIPYMVSIRKGV